MSQLDTHLAAASATAQAIMDTTTFTVGGGTFKGVFSSHTDTLELGDGGYAEGITASISAMRAQFVTAAVTPAEGNVVVRGGVSYRIARIASDDVFYDLILTGLNQ